MANGQLQITGLQTFLPSGAQSQLGPYTVPFTATESDTLTSLASGNNTIAVPATAGGVLLIPQVGNTIAVTIKGIAADTGLPLSLVYPFLWEFAAPGAPSSFVLNAASAVSLVIRFT